MVVVCDVWLKVVCIDLKSDLGKWVSTKL